MENKLESLSDIGHVDKFIFDKNDIKQLKDNKIQVETSTSRDLDDNIKKTLANFPEDKDVVMFLLDPREVSPEGLELVSKTYSTDEWLIMEDHPDGQEDICATKIFFKPCNGKYAIIFCNRREKLN
jgi:hypothetical protein